MSRTYKDMKQKYWINNEKLMQREHPQYFKKKFY